MRKSILQILFQIIISGPLMAQPIDGYRVYYGTLHNHCRISDGQGSVALAYQLARDSYYDFFGLSDHAEMIISPEWALMKITADSYNEDGVFATFWGFEWTSPQYGHVTVVGSTDYSSCLSSATNSFAELVSWINTRKCIAFFDHPGYSDGLGNEFRHFTTWPSEKFVGMELWNTIASFDRSYYNDGYYRDDGGLSYFDEALKRGWKVGAGGSEDNHTGNWGSEEAAMAVLSDTLTRSSIWDALISRRFYATLDRNLQMSFRIQGQEMGSRLHPGHYTGEIRLHDRDNEVFTSAELLWNGTVTQTFDMEESDPRIPFTVDAGNNDYFYIRVHQQDGDQAVSSPIFFGDQYVTGPVGLNDYKRDQKLSIVILRKDRQQYLILQGAGETETAIIADLTGRIVSVFPVYPGEPVDISGMSLPGGIYLVMLREHPGIIARKLMVE